AQREERHPDDAPPRARRDERRDTRERPVSHRRAQARHPPLAAARGDRRVRDRDGALHRVEGAEVALAAARPRTEARLAPALVAARHEAAVAQRRPRGGAWAACATTPARR